MGGPEDDSFHEGDAVLLPDDSVGTLLRVVGRGKWAVKVDGQDKSKVLSVASLRKYAMKAPAGQKAADQKQAIRAPRRYCIVGSWDDWESHDMNWNADLMCLEYVVTIGSNDRESFKFVQDDDWDMCVHPGRSNAFPGDGHSTLGPEDGGLDSEWTIGFQPADRAAEGTCHQVRLFLLPDGSPKRVDWSLLTPESASVATAAPERVESEAQRVAPAESEMRREDAEPEAAGPRSTGRQEAGGHGVVLDYEPITRSAGGERLQARVEAPEARRMGEQVLAHERAARARLAERFDAALAVPDGGLAKQHAEELEFRLAINRRRYQSESTGNIDGLMDPGYAQGRSSRSGRGRGEGTCVECGNPTTEMWNFAAYCCRTCVEDFNALVKEGWNGDIVIDGTSASDRARGLQKEFEWTAQEARIAVMRLFSHMFRPGAVQMPVKKPEGLQRCTQCSGASWEGQCTSDGSFYCSRCWASRQRTPAN